MKNTTRRYINKKYEIITIYIILSIWVYVDILKG